MPGFYPGVLEIGTSDNRVGQMKNESQHFLAKQAGTQHASPLLNGLIADSMLGAMLETDWGNSILAWCLML